MPLRAGALPRPPPEGLPVPEGQFPPGKPVEGRPRPAPELLPVLLPLPLREPPLPLLPLFLLMMYSEAVVPEVAKRSVFQPREAVGDRVWKGCRERKRSASWHFRELLQCPDCRSAVQAGLNAVDWQSVLSG